MFDEFRWDIDWSLNFIDTYLHIPLFIFEPYTSLYAPHLQIPLERRPKMPTSHEISLDPGRDSTEDEYLLYRSETLCYTVQRFLGYKEWTRPTLTSQFLASQNLSIHTLNSMGLCFLKVSLKVLQNSSWFCWWRPKILTGNGTKSHSSTSKTYKMDAGLYRKPSQRYGVARPLNTRPL